MYIDMGAYEYGTYWTGAVSSDWFLPANWSNSEVPGSGNSVSIILPYTNPPLVTAHTQCKELWLEEGVEVTVQAGVTLTVGD